MKAERFKIDLRAILIDMVKNGEGIRPTVDPRWANRPTMPIRFLTKKQDAAE